MCTNCAFVLSCIQTMKSLRASGSDEHKSAPNLSRSQHQNLRNTTTANPRDVSITVANQTVVTNSATNNAGAANKKHGLGLRRFSLRRLFNQSTIGRTVSTRHSKPPKEKHSSDSGSASDTKVCPLALSANTTEY